MKSFIALFRGLNVGGSGVLPMKDLVAILEQLGFGDIKTYIQSGNVVFRTEEDDPARIAKRITSEVVKGFGFEPQVLLLEPAELRRAMEANPFPEAASEPKTLHLTFMAEEPLHPDLEALERLRKDSESYALKGTVFYLHAPEGIGRSKLAAKVEHLLGVPGTSRNWRTVTRVLALAEAEEG
jgi:uncharacterized protein (DUF1697 family)